MKNIFAASLSILLAACASTMQRQYFPPHSERAPDAAVVINMAVIDGYQYYVKSVDGVKVGNLLTGTGMIHEIHLKPGNHRLNVVVGYVNGAQPVYTGEISCEVQSNLYYTIQTSENINTNRYSSPDSVRVRCLAHKSKPKNEHLERLVRGRGLKLSEDFFEPPQ